MFAGESAHLYLHKEDWVMPRDQFAELFAILHLEIA